MIYLQEVISDLITGKRFVLTIGLCAIKNNQTMIVLISGTIGEQKHADDIIVYDMPDSALKKSTLTLSNGKRLQSVWPELAKVSVFIVLNLLTNLYIHIYEPKSSKSCK